jgi:hypothetical protein
MKLTCANITLDEVAPIEKAGAEAIEKAMQSLTFPR